MMFLVKKVLVSKKKLTNLLARDINESKVSLRRRVVKRCRKTYFIFIQDFLTVRHLHFGITYERSD